MQTDPLPGINHLVDEDSFMDIRPLEFQRTMGQSQVAAPAGRDWEKRNLFRLHCEPFSESDWSVVCKRTSQHGWTPAAMPLGYLTRPNLATRFALRRDKVTLRKR